MVGRTGLGLFVGPGWTSNLNVSRVGLFICGEVGRKFVLVNRSGAPRAFPDREIRSVIPGRGSG